MLTNKGVHWAPIGLPKCLLQREFEPTCPSLYGISSVFELQDYTVYRHVSIVSGLPLVSIYLASIFLYFRPSVDFTSS